MLTRKFSLILIFSIILTLGLSISLGSLLAAWTAPASAPPEGNIAAPINTSDTGQAKQGGLILNTGGSANGLIVQFGNVGIGTANPQAKLEVAGNIIAADPTTNNQVATKAYVDAAAGGGSLKVYKSDGTTLLGTFGGFFGDSPTAISGWGWWTPAGALHIASSADLSYRTYGTLHYQYSDCSDNPDAEMGGSTGLYTDNIKCILANGGTTYISRRGYVRSYPGGVCYEYQGAGTWYTGDGSQPCSYYNTALCGYWDYPCIVK